MNTKPIHHKLDRMHEATMDGSIAPVDIYWLIAAHGQLVNEHDQTVLKLAVAETEAADLRRQLAAAQTMIGVSDLYAAYYYREMRQQASDSEHPDPMSLELWYESNVDYLRGVLKSSE